MDEQNTKPSYWAVLPATVRYDKDLPPSARLLYAEISSLTNETGYCFAGNEYFVDLYHLSERTIRRLLGLLAERGYIIVEDGDGGAGRRKIYAGVNPVGNPDKNVRVPLPPGQKCPGNPDKNVRTTLDNNKSIKPPKAPRGGCAWEPEAFERFWRAYPRKEDKASARREWDKLKPDRKLMATMSAALDRAKTSDEWLRGIGIPYAVRWLRNRRWEDLPVELPQAEPVRKLVGERW